MINFLQASQENATFKTWLYTPGGVFQGEIITMNPQLKLSLEGVPSEFSFELPENIIVYQGGEYVSIVNPRINDILDQFQIEVWYGDLEKVDATPQKSRFIITKTPTGSANEKTSFSYVAYSKEYEMKSVKILSWLGVEINEYIQTFEGPYTAVSNIVTLDLESGIFPRNAELIRVTATKDIQHRLAGFTMGEVDYVHSFGSQSPVLTSIVVQDAETPFDVLVKDTHYTVDSYIDIIG